MAEMMAEMMADYWVGLTALKKVASTDYMMAGGWVGVWV
jgi:hypothetical protein